MECGSWSCFNLDFDESGDHNCDDCMWNAFSPSDQDGNFCSCCRLPPPPPGLPAGYKAREFDKWTDYADTACAVVDVIGDPLDLQHVRGPNDCTNMENLVFSSCAKTRRLLGFDGDGALHEDVPGLEQTLRLTGGSAKYQSRYVSTLQAIMFSWHAHAGALPLPEGAAPISVDQYDAQAACEADEDCVGFVYPQRHWDYEPSAKGHVWLVSLAHLRKVNEPLVPNHDYEWTTHLKPEHWAHWKVPHQWPIEELASEYSQGWVHNVSKAAQGFLDYLDANSTKHAALLELFGGDELAIDAFLSKLRRAAGDRMDDTLGFTRDEDKSRRRLVPNPMDIAGGACAIYAAGKTCVEAGVFDGKSGSGWECAKGIGKSLIETVTGIKFGASIFDGSAFGIGGDGCVTRPARCRRIASECTACPSTRRFFFFTHKQLKREREIHGG